MKRILILAFAAVALSASAAAAQSCIGSCSVTAQIQVTVPPVLKISLASAFAFPAITANDVDLQNTLTATTAPALTTKGNVPYKVEVSTDADDFALDNAFNAADNTYLKPTSDVVLTVGAHAPVALSSTAAELYVEPRGTDVTRTPTATLKINDTDAAARYTTIVTFTIAAQ